MNEILAAKAKQIRRELLQITSSAGTSHIGSMLSITDIMVYLFYNHIDFNEKNFRSEDRDRFILSKGHASLVLYSILYDKGIIKDVSTYCRNGGYLIGHVNHKVDGIEVSTGSLGHGLPMATGIALGLKMDKKESKVYCLLGDGECQEGSVWEALIFISNHLLNNLVIIIDSNNLQGYDYCEKIFDIKKLKAMIKSLGLEFYEGDGHNFDSIRQIFDEIDKQRTDKAKVILLNTVKGKGVSFMENRLEWHYKNPNEQELARALEELK